jgi:periplasmic divalent cation tolerance protein
MPQPIFVTILVTCPNRAVGESIGRTLVEERLAACANLIPGLTSIYRWQGRVHRDREVLLVIKARRRQFRRLAARVASLHPYDTPQIVALPIVAGAKRYLAWLAESTA